MIETQTGFQRRRAEQQIDQRGAASPRLTAVHKVGDRRARRGRWCATPQIVAAGCRASDRCGRTRYAQRCLGAVRPRQGEPALRRAARLARSAGRAGRTCCGMPAIDREAAAARTPTRRIGTTRRSASWCSSEGAGTTMTHLRRCPSASADRSSTLPPRPVGPRPDLEDADLARERLNERAVALVSHRLPRAAEDAQAPRRDRRGRAVGAGGDGARRRARPTRRGAGGAAGDDEPPRLPDDPRALPVRPRSALTVLLPRRTRHRGRSRHHLGRLSDRAAATAGTCSSSSEDGGRRAARAKKAAQRRLGSLARKSGP